MTCWRLSSVPRTSLCSSCAGVSGVRRLSGIRYAFRCRFARAVTRWCLRFAWTGVPGRQLSPGNLVAGASSCTRRMITSENGRMVSRPCGEHQLHPFNDGPVARRRASLPSSVLHIRKTLMTFRQEQEPAELPRKSLVALYRADGTQHERVQTGSQISLISPVLG
jgi:hypothetical protein